ncbi:cysteine desulfurase [Candidatus Nitromaritima sp. SCGC AAA799-A02]|nr:cysteine desulfurase [Candidatus Nitromaritima sp. SCGC AAA799-A02]
MQKIYLDHNATTPLAPEVLDAMLPLYRDGFGNPSSVHSEGRSARVRLDEAREQVAGLIGAESGEIVFTSGGTEANNFAILGAALAPGNKKRHIVTCEIEHPSVLNPLKQMEALGYQLERLPVDRFGRIDPERVRRALTDSTALVTLQHANSEVGTLQDIERIGGFVRERGILFHTDAVQSVGKIAVNVKTLPVDLLSLSAHKLYGPKGMGALFIRRGTQPLFSPVCGGGQEKKRRGGTENVPGIVGFGKACQLAQDYLERGGTEHLKDLRDRLWEKIGQSVTGAQLFGDPDNRLPNTLGCGFEGADGETLLIALDMEGISVSTGSACSSGTGQPSAVLSAMQVSGERINSSLRLSLGRGNTADEMDRVAATLGRAVRQNREKILPGQID